MENTNNPRRDSKNLQAPAEVTIPRINLKRHNKSSFSEEHVGKVMTLILGLIIMLGISILLFMKKRVHNGNPHEIEKVSNLEMDVSAFTDDYKKQTEYILTLNCTYYCSCLIYTEMEPFGNASYENFWSIVEDNKNMNVQVISVDAEHHNYNQTQHLEKREDRHKHTKSPAQNNKENNDKRAEHNKMKEHTHNKNINLDQKQQIVLSGSHFYQYSVSCAQRSSKHLFPYNNSPSNHNIKTFSKITTHPSPLYFTYTIFGIIKNSFYLHYLNIDDQRQFINRLVNKYTSYIIPRAYKEHLNLKVDKKSELLSDGPNIEETVNSMNNKNKTVGVIAPIITKNRNNPSMVKLSGFVAQSLNVECRTSKHGNQNRNENTTYGIDDIKVGSPFIEQTKNLTKYSNIVHRYADNFNDFNGASTVRFEMKLIGLSPGKHDLICLLSKIDETTDVDAIESKTTLPILGYKSVIEIPPFVEQEEFTKNEYKYEKLAQWFYRAGYLDVYVLFDFKYLQGYIEKNKKELDVSYSLGNLIQWSFKRPENKEKVENKTKKDSQGDKEWEMLKMVKGYIKNIINGNLITKTELNSIYFKWSDFLSDSKLEMDDFLHFQIKVLTVLSLASNLTTLSIVPVDILSNNSFKYYSLWNSIKQITIDLMGNSSLLYKDYVSTLKALLFKQLKLYYILRKTSLNGKREIIVDNCVREISGVMVSLFACEKVKNRQKGEIETHNVFKGCSKDVEAININLLVNEYSKVLHEKTINEILNTVLKRL